MTVFTTRPVILGSRGVVTSGHYLATAAGFRIMEQGGNAIDAAAAICFCLREVIGDLQRRGHEVAVTDGWTNGKVMGIRYDPGRGVIQGAVSPRRNIGYALGW